MLLKGKITAWIPAFAGMTALLFLTCSMRGDETRISWDVDTTYSGSETQACQKLQWIVPNLIRQTTINLAVRLGLQFQEGWQYPMTVGFVDQAPRGVESALAYTQLGFDGRHIRQRLNINVAAYTRDNFNFEKVLAHELVHAMLNDAIGAESAVILPVWLHEGLAVYGADQGEQMVRSYAAQFPDDHNQMINGLEGPHTGLDYAEDYLAIKYIYKEHGVNALHNFVRELVARKGDVAGALEYPCHETWPQFQKHARAFALQELGNIPTTKMQAIEKPY